MAVRPDDLLSLLFDSVGGAPGVEPVQPIPQPSGPTPGPLGVPFGSVAGGETQKLRIGPLFEEEDIDRLDFIEDERLAQEWFRYGDEDVPHHHHHHHDEEY